MFEHRLQGAGQFFEGAILQKVARCARLEGTHHKLFVGMHGKYDDFGAREFGHNLAGGIDAVEIGHVQIHDDHAGLQPAGQLDGSPAVFGFGHHRHARLLFNQRTQAIAHDFVIVGQQNFCAHDC